MTSDMFGSQTLASRSCCTHAAKWKCGRGVRDVVVVGGSQIDAASLLQPSHERICHGERSLTATHCCLGCVQTKMLTELSEAALAAADKGLSPAAAGAAAAEEMTRRHPASVAVATEALRRATAHSAPSSVADADMRSGESRRSSAAASTELSRSTASRLERTAGAAGTASESHGSTTGLARSAQQSPPLIATRSRMAELHMIDPPQLAVLATVPAHSKSAAVVSTPADVAPLAAQATSGRAGGTGGLGGALRGMFHRSNVAAPPTAAMSTAPVIVDVVMEMADAASGDLLFPTQLRRKAAQLQQQQQERARGEDSGGDAVGLTSAAPRFGAVISPTVVLDCTCGHSGDDGTGWYKGRAGTSAYWCPQVWREMQRRMTFSHTHSFTSSPLRSLVLRRPDNRCSDEQKKVTASRTAARQTGP
jgi:hypothetical protein